MENSLNTMRAILVAAAALAAVIALGLGRPVVAAVLGVGVLFHGAMWLYLWRERARQARQHVQPPV